MLDGSATEADKKRRIAAFRLIDAEIVLKFTATASRRVRWNLADGAGAEGGPKSGSGLDEEKGEGDESPLPTQEFGGVKDPLADAEPPATGGVGAHLSGPLGGEGGVQEEEGMGLGVAAETGVQPLPPPLWSGSL
jgi:hypothetical protein